MLFHLMMDGLLMMCLEGEPSHKAPQLQRETCNRAGTALVLLCTAVFLLPEMEEGTNRKLMTSVLLGLAHSL